MSNLGTEYENFFTKTYSLYKWVAGYLLMLEKIDSNYVNVGAINELRDIVSHLYAFTDKVKLGATAVEINHIKATDHLERAYLDLFSALCTVLTERITKFEVIYPSQVISEEYPNYFTEIRPHIHNLYDEEGNVRLNRDLNDMSATESNDTIIKKLREFHNSLTKTIPNFNKKKKELDRKKFWKRFFTIVPILLAIAGLIIAFVEKK